MHASLLLCIKQGTDGARDRNSEGPMAVLQKSLQNKRKVRFPPLFFKRERERQSLLPGQAAQVGRQIKDEEATHVDVAL